LGYSITVGFCVGAQEVGFIDTGCADGPADVGFFVGDRVGLNVGASVVGLHEVGPQEVGFPVVGAPVGVRVKVGAWLGASLGVWLGDAEPDAMPKRACVARRRRKPLAVIK